MSQLDSNAVAAAAPAVSVSAARVRVLLWTGLMWAVLGMAVLAIVLGIMDLLVWHADGGPGGSRIAAAILWMKLLVVAALFWTTALRGLTHWAVAARLRGVVEPSAAELRVRAKDKFARASGLLADMMLAMLFELLIVFFALFVWLIFGSGGLWVVFFMVLAVLGAVGHWLVEWLIGDVLGRQVEEA